MRDVPWPIRRPDDDSRSPTKVPCVWCGREFGPWYRTQARTAMTGKFCSFECSAAWHSNEAFLRRWPDGNPFSPGIVAECRAALAKLPVLTLEQVSS